METNRLSEAIIRLVKLAARLRGPEGCPWDAKQTEHTVKYYLLEEAYEVVEAIGKKAPQLVCGELGDLLFQIVFIAQLASERGEFDLADVIEQIEKKMIRRHPHVFGDVEVKDAEEVAWNWAKIKEKEKGDEGAKGARALRDVPVSLPALLRCHRLCERASKLKVKPGNMEDLSSLIKRGLRWLESSGKGKLYGTSEKDVGCALFALAEAIRERGGNAEDLLQQANERFLSAIEALEGALHSEGLELEEADESHLKGAWERIKKKI